MVCNLLIKFSDQEPNEDSLNNANAAVLESEESEDYEDVNLSDFPGNFY